MIKTILCRVGATEWELVRLEQPDFKHISRLGITGHPAYYRVVPPDEEPEMTGAIKQSSIDTHVRGYEVWPLPAHGVEVIPVYEPDDA